MKKTWRNQPRTNWKKLHMELTSRNLQLASRFIEQEMTIARLQENNRKMTDSNRFLMDNNLQLHNRLINSTQDIKLWSERNAAQNKMIQALTEQRDAIHQALTNQDLKIRISNMG